MAGGATRTRPANAPAAPAAPLRANQNVGNQNMNPNVIVAILPLDTLIPMISADNEANIKSKFKNQKLTKIDGEPTHTTMTLPVRELGRNAITSKTSFGCKKRGCFGIMKDVLNHRQDSGFDLSVPATEGACPIFDANDNKHDKKVKISNFVTRETNILVVEATHTLLKDQLTKVDMVIQLVEHMGTTGTHTKASVIFNKLPEVEQTWKKAKFWFREAVLIVDEMEKYSGINGDLLANAVVIKENVAQEARNEVASRMQESFSQLAQAAVAKLETIDAHVASISSLAKAIAEMTATCKTLTATNSTLVTALAKCGGKNANNPPPGFSKTGTTTSHALNYDSVACPTHKRNGVKLMTFVNGQHCASCRRLDQWHLPVDWLELPYNVARKALIKAKRLVRQGGKGKGVTASISSLAKALAEMTATCKTLAATNSTLVTALAKCGGKNANTPPPGFSKTGTTTSHALNSDSVACPTHKRNGVKLMTFVNGQHCASCRRLDQWHLPVDWLELPYNVARKALIKAKRLVRDADKAVKAKA